MNFLIACVCISEILTVAAIIKVTNGINLIRLFFKKHPEPDADTFH